MSQSELARRLDTDRTTIWRWEHGRQRPDDPDIVARWARALGLDVDEALAAAGFRPGVEVPPAPTVEVDEEIELVRTDQRLSPDMKRRIIDIILDRREKDRQRRIEETRRLIDLFRDSRVPPSDGSPPWRPTGCAATGSTRATAGSPSPTGSPSTGPRTRPDSSRARSALSGAGYAHTSCPRSDTSPSPSWTR